MVKIENFNFQSWVRNEEDEKYAAMCGVVLNVLPKRPSELTHF